MHDGSFSFISLPSQFSFDGCLYFSSNHLSGEIAYLSSNLF